MDGMKTLRRLYDAILADHLRDRRQMALVSGPRQVGKTTTCRNLADHYANWDDLDHREQILAGPSHLVEWFGLDRLAAGLPTLLFDELHKFPRWKQFLKGFFDSHADRARIIVTGSGHLDVYRRGGDSLMGRYFRYRMHPFSAAEAVHTDLPDPARIVRMPVPLDDADWTALWEHGGFPEPYLKRDPRFSRRWQSLRGEQLVREDIRDLTQVQHLDQIEALVHLLMARSSRQLVFANLARDVRVSVDTLRRWIGVLCDLQLGFVIRPWHRNVSRSLRKEPHWFLRDWAMIDDPGDRAETLVGCHLLKAVEGWTDLGLGGFALHYIRDKEKREVDFVVIRDGRPWFLVEVKHRDTRLSRALGHFQAQVSAPHAFQVVIEADHVAADCFSEPGEPMIVPARTFLTQLV